MRLEAEEMAEPDIQILDEPGFDVYPKSDKNSLEDFKQESDRIRLAFLKGLYMTVAWKMDYGL